MSSSNSCSITIHQGHSHSLGVSTHGEFFNFALYAPDLKQLSLSLYHIGEREPFFQTDLNAKLHQTNGTWHVAMSQLPERFEYSYHSPSLDCALVDPYAKHLSSPRHFGTSSDVPTRAVFYPTAPFDWQGVSTPNHPLSHLVIYEMHVRGFTQDASSSVAHPGTFLGMIEKIPYLKDLGVNAVELLPIFEFDECSYRAKNPINGEVLCQYFGYSPTHFFVPMGRYTAGGHVTAPTQEFKTLVRELHRAGIEVILDVVYNHTGSVPGHPTLPTLAPLAKQSYYLTDTDGSHTNYSGCGNTLNCNHPATTHLIVESLRYWVQEMRVDGFRFDLGSILTRGTDGNPMDKPPLLDAILNDPVLQHTKLIAEAWDAAGLYQVGHFAADSARFCEWNGRYRDDVRQYLTGRQGLTGAFATRLSGSEDLYAETRKPHHSINFVTAHDGFSLRDLVSYQSKHNQANGESNRDGANFNNSWNCGEEGATLDSEILNLRDQQMRNHLLALFLSQGTPMLHMGDEYGHTKLGNNNTWCQDNRLNYFCWDQLQQNKQLFTFVQQLTQLRNQLKSLGQDTFLSCEDVTWYTPDLSEHGWDRSYLALVLKGIGVEPTLFAAFNPTDVAIEATLPDGEWTCVASAEKLTQRFELAPYSSRAAVSTHS